MQINRDVLIPFVEGRIQKFHQKRIDSLQEMQLNKVLKRKNPYLFRAKNITTSYELIKGLLDAHLSSQEEGLFGGLLEELSIYVNEIAFKGRKSAAEGIDLEFERDEIHYIVAVKSGPNWGNSGQIAKMVDNFKKAKKILGTNRTARNVVAVNGCCYGQVRNPDKGDYLKLCGQRFWELISADADLYLDIIEPLGHSAKEKNEEFDKQYGGVINRMSTQFGLEFCDSDGHILWEKIVQFNSGYSTEQSSND